MSYVNINDTCVKIDYSLQIEENERFFVVTFYFTRKTCNGLIYINLKNTSFKELQPIFPFSYVGWSIADIQTQGHTDVLIFDNGSTLALNTDS